MVKPFAPERLLEAVGKALPESVKAIAKLRRAPAPRARGPHRPNFWLKIWTGVRPNNAE